LEQKWASRIDPIHTASNATPPRDPNDDDDYQDEVEEDEEQSDLGKSRHTRARRVPCPSG